MKIFLILTFFCFACTNANAQQQPPKINKDSLAMLEARSMQLHLKLNKKQTEIIAIENKNFFQQMDSVNASGISDLQTLRAARKKIIDRHESELKKIMTAQQYTQFKTDMEERRIRSEQRIKEEKEKLKKNH
jgi:hypothetical protein